MIGAVVENIIGGYLHPRASVRRLLKADHGIDAALLMLILAFVLREIMMIVTPGAPVGSDELGLAWYVIGLAGFLLQFAFAVLLVSYLGRMFGGRGTPVQTAVVLAWYELVTSVVFPLLQAGAQAIYDAVPKERVPITEPVIVPLELALAVIAGAGVVVWLFAAYIAELHGFRRTVSVLAAVIALVVPIYMAAVAIIASA